MREGWREDYWIEELAIARAMVGEENQRGHEHIEGWGRKKKTLESSSDWPPRLSTFFLFIFFNIQGVN